MSVAWMASWSFTGARSAITAAALGVLLLVAAVLSQRPSAREAHKRGARILDGRPAQRRTARLLPLRQRHPCIEIGARCQQPCQ